MHLGDNICGGQTLCYPERKHRKLRSSSSPSQGRLVIQLIVSTPCYSELSQRHLLSQMEIGVCKHRFDADLMEHLSYIICSPEACDMKAIPANIFSGLMLETVVVAVVNKI